MGVPDAELPPSAQKVQVAAGMQTGSLRRAQTLVEGAPPSLSPVAMHPEGPAYPQAAPCAFWAHARPHPAKPG